ncbi:DUF4185 domain-containing protein [Dictyobacter formicarum]|uniref:DUF4185 domain-containing protein n=1 Tax=Dictyobacter formicarum TaxID=2778368 RepID=A0ABQ3VMQ7_9CHLR|nr:DUF4185 domain-containing protein [Dictyobacter formicarum]GHO87512.1 hypothetical protein KSZ_55180 [Dictyobacter formicarum]
MIKRLTSIFLTAMLVVMVSIPFMRSSSAHAATTSSRNASLATTPRQAYATQNLVQDSGFEQQTTGTVSAPWNVEGPGSQGIDLNAGFAHSGLNNAWIRTSDSNWHAIIQAVPVQPNTNYTLTGWIQNSFAQNVGYFGVRKADGVTVLQEMSFGTLPFYTQQIVNFNSGPNTTVTVYGGFWGQGTDYWARFDDISLRVATLAPQSTFFATAQEESYSTYQTPSDGDLWPSCWADDNNLYAANGDGTAFSGGTTNRFDMAVSRISGTPPNLTGTTLATNVGTNWSGPAYYLKPTGMLCVNNTIYLAFQNIQRDHFNSVPAASIAKSVDHGATWTWDANAPMFPNSAFTTIFFLDYGKNYANSIDGYVYAYGFDSNWRDQQSLYLGRVPSASVQTRSSWQFYTGTDGSGNPTWSSDINAKVPVLEDDRQMYPQTFGNFCCTNGHPFGQGGVTYDAPLHRYIFSSWSYATHEFYESPNPWGPWSLFMSKDFGPIQLTQNRGQYGTSIPSKFISADGKSMYLQSNVCCSGDSYNFDLRKMYVQPYTSTTPANARSDTNNLAQTGNGTTAISKSTHFGSLSGANFTDSLNNGNLSENEDDYDQAAKTQDWWGYTWNQAYNLNKVVYTTGNMFSDGGWYSNGLTVQVRQNFQWVNVSGLHVTPSYPYSNAAGANTNYVFTFNDTWGDGVRIIGTPGGSSYFTSIAELSAYYTTKQYPMRGFSQFGTNRYQMRNDGSIWFYQGSTWQELDNNVRTSAMATDGSGNLYQLRNDGSIWFYQGTPFSWQEVDNNPAATAIAVDGKGHLYQLHNDGTVWLYQGIPMTGWQELDKWPGNIGLATDGLGGLYLLHTDGSIWKYQGTPYTWQELDNNPLTISIEADGKGNLYQLHNDGTLWLYQGTPMTGWQELDSWSGNIAFAVDNVGGLYLLHTDGTIYKYLGTPNNWQQVDNNPAAVAIAADGNGDLYQLHNDGSIWLYQGTPITGWQRIDNNPASVVLSGAY